ncbi:MAG TPA: hypothetical protein VD867_05795 [Burkholderiales bacterium]|nr:hypothetical protein [Burkholderiales bacterium]
MGRASSTEGHIRGIPVLIIRGREVDVVRRQRRFWPLDGYPDGVHQVHDYEIGAFFEDDKIGRRIIVRKQSDRRAVFTDEHFIELYGEDGAQIHIERQHQRANGRRWKARDKGGGTALTAPVLLNCSSCAQLKELTHVAHDRPVCLECSAAMKALKDSPERFRLVADFLERVLPRRAAPGGSTVRP